MLNIFISISTSSDRFGMITSQTVLASFLLTIPISEKAEACPENRHRDHKEGPEKGCFLRMHSAFGEY